MYGDGIAYGEIVEVLDKLELYYELELTFRSGKIGPLNEAVFYDKPYYTFNLTSGIVSNVLLSNKNLELGINNDWYDNPKELSGFVLKRNDKLKIRSKIPKWTTLVSCSVQLQIPVIGNHES